MSMHFLRQMLTTFKGITRQTMDESANVKLVKLIHKELMDKLNLSPAYAAELVGGMEISVDSDAYNSDPELFNEMAVEMVRVVETMFNVFAEDWGNSAALSYIKVTTAKMSLTYG